MEIGEVITLRWWRHEKPLPDGAVEHPPSAYVTIHDYWSRLIEIPTERPE